MFAWKKLSHLIGFQLNTFVESFKTSNDVNGDLDLDSNFALLILVTFHVSRLRSIFLFIYSHFSVI